MSLTESTDHVERAEALLLEQFKGKVNIAALLSAYIGQTQKIETALFEVLNETNLDNAVGESLNVLGRIVGEDRNGRDDETYRLRIRARIKLNRSNGLVEEIYAIMLLVLGTSYEHELQQYYPASLVYRLHGAIDEDTAQEAANILRQARAAGIGSSFEYSVEAEGDTFTFASGDSSETDADTGFADDDETAGGYFADAFVA